MRPIKLLPLALASTPLAGSSRKEPLPKPVHAVRRMTRWGGRTERRLSLRAGGNLVQRGMEPRLKAKAGQLLATLHLQDPAQQVDQQVTDKFERTLQAVPCADKIRSIPSWARH